MQRGYMRGSEVVVVGVIVIVRDMDRGVAHVTMDGQHHQSVTRQRKGVPL